jgi:hypothetical protein
LQDILGTNHLILLIETQSMHRLIICWDLKLGEILFWNQTYSMINVVVCPSSIYGFLLPLWYLQTHLSMYSYIPQTFISTVHSFLTLIIEYVWFQNNISPNFRSQHIISRCMLCVSINNTIVNRKGTKEQTTIYKTYT